MFRNLCLGLLISLTTIGNTFPSFASGRKGPLSASDDTVHSQSIGRPLNPEVVASAGSATLRDAEISREEYKERFHESGLELGIRDALFSVHLDSPEECKLSLSSQTTHSRSGTEVFFEAKQINTSEGSRIEVAARSKLKDRERLVFDGSPRLVVHTRDPLSLDQISGKFISYRRIEDGRVHHYVYNWNTGDARRTEVPADALKVIFAETSDRKDFVVKAYTTFPHEGASALMIKRDHDNEDARFEYLHILNASTGLFYSHLPSFWSNSIVYYTIEGEGVIVSNQVDIENCRNNQTPLGHVSFIGELYLEWARACKVGLVFDHTTGQYLPVTLESSPRANIKCLEYLLSSLRTALSRSPYPYQLVSFNTVDGVVVGEFNHYLTDLTHTVSTNGATYKLQDAERLVALIGHRDRFSVPKVVHLEFEDRPLFYYLTLPKVSGRHGLYVNIHGGPFGPLSTTQCTQFVPYISGEFATIRPMFRGSGHTFLDEIEGFGEALSGSVRDIVACITHCMSTHPDLIDPRAIFIDGGSYGGLASALLQSFEEEFFAGVGFTPTGYICYNAPFDIVRYAEDCSFEFGTKAKLCIVSSDKIHPDGSLTEEGIGFLESRSPLLRPNIHKPTFIVVGEKDPIVPQEHTTRFLDAVVADPNSDERLMTVMRVKGAGHSLMVKEMKSVAAMMRNFMVTHAPTLDLSLVTCDAIDLPNRENCEIIHGASYLFGDE